MKKILLVVATAFLSASLVMTSNTASACDKDGKKDKKEASCSKAQTDGKACCSKSTAKTETTTSATASFSTAAAVVSADPASAPAKATVVDVVVPATDAAPAKAVTVEKK